MREIKFRCWNPVDMEMIADPLVYDSVGLNDNFENFKSDEYQLMQYIGLKDKKGVEIYFNDILRFSDKWEWYKREYGIKMMAANKEKKKELQAKYDAEPYEERVVKSIEDYEWLLSSEIQQYWEVIGNIYENPELLAKPATT